MLNHNDNNIGCKSRENENSTVCTRIKRHHGPFGRWTFLDIHMQNGAPLIFLDKTNTILQIWYKCNVIAKMVPSVTWSGDKKWDITSSDALFLFLFNNLPIHSHKLQSIHPLTFSLFLFSFLSSHKKSRTVNHRPSLHSASLSGNLFSKVADKKWNVTSINGLSLFK